MLVFACCGICCVRESLNERRLGNSICAPLPPPLGDRPEVKCALQLSLAGFPQPSQQPPGRACQASLFSSGIQRYSQRWGTIGLVSEP
eukprot:4763189-Alexandrium_andersonii.AAC.1